MGIILGTWKGTNNHTDTFIHIYTLPSQSQSLNPNIFFFLLSRSIPKGMTASSTIQWALCHVASRATAASEKFGALRLVPMLDMINHDVNAGGFEELNGKERLFEGGFVDADENDAGAFVVRSSQHGRRKPLRKGQELLANYNVPNYSPLDWFVSMGFVPPERTGKWTKVENVLPKTRTYAM